MPADPKFLLFRCFGSNPLDFFLKINAVTLQRCVLIQKGQKSSDFRPLRIKAQKENLSSG